jgi:AraC family transcriptional regulator, regulatory protein of adaptative response / methylated-DNA-[protein]-cysteine methyltransferase
LPAKIFFAGKIRIASRLARVHDLGMASNQQPELNPIQAWQQVLSRDSSASFVYAVASTGIFCRPSCPSRRPAPSNVCFFIDPAEALAAGYRACKRCAPIGERSEAATVARLCRYLAAHRDRAVTLADLAKVARSSPFTIQRKFTRVMGISPRAYQAQLRSTYMRRSLSTPGASVTGAIYEAGYGSSSRFYEQAATQLGMSPTRFRERGLNETIRFATTPCELGLLLVAATERGVCSVMLGDEAGELEQLLRQQFSAAEVVPDASGMAEHMAAVLAAMTEHPAAGDLPLDLRATAFQARVWQALRQIPRGQTRSYADIARAVGQPTAVRAVARACATNPVAIAIPCHRVIGSNGSLTGYRWGTERKQKLLSMERMNLQNEP